MFQFAPFNLTHLLIAYGYWAVFVFVAIESIGIPFPGETMLLVASIYAGTTHHLFIPLVIAAATAGASWAIIWDFGLGVKVAIACSVATAAPLALKNAG